MLEDECQMVLECPKYDSLRRRYFPRRYRQKSMFNFIAAFTYKAFGLRDELLKWCLKPSPKTQFVLLDMCKFHNIAVLILMKRCTCFDIMLYIEPVRFIAQSSDLSIYCAWWNFMLCVIRYCALCYVILYLMLCSSVPDAIIYYAWCYILLFLMPLCHVVNAIVPNVMFYCAWCYILLCPILYSVVPDFMFYFAWFNIPFFIFFTFLISFISFTLCSFIYWTIEFTIYHKAT